jgi:dUTP pyrophosphatase
VTIAIKLRRMEGRPELPMPSYATALAAGLDLISAHEHVLPSGSWAAVGTGLEIELPPGFEAQVRPRSGLAMKHGVTVLNAPGTIDADYRGEIRVLLINLGRESYRITPGDRIAQLVIAPVARVEVLVVEDLSPTARGSGGFGHTGK